MYLYLAIFWLVVGVLLQVYWDVVAPYSLLPPDRTRPVMGAIFFVLFSYNIVRWRLARAMEQARREAEAMAHPPPKHATPVEYDPAFDFSKPSVVDEKPADEAKKDPPA